MKTAESSVREKAGVAAFGSTHWSVVLAAGGAPGEGSTLALEQLCRAYWYPLYAYLRRQGHSRSDAEDLTQGFFAFLLERQGFQGLHPDKGRFRSFLLAALKNFAANAWDKARAQKRGGLHQIIPLDEVGEVLFKRESVEGLSPDRAYAQSWAMTLINGVLSRLREEYAATGKAELFDAMQVHLTEDRGRIPYADTAARLGLGEGALRMAVLRLRRRFGDLLRETVAHTVSRPEDVEPELRELLGAWVG
jgi:DNA-directed RNA polymerase specialized sigma24 family protein